MIHIDLLLFFFRILQFAPLTNINTQSETFMQILCDMISSNRNDDWDSFRSNPYCVWENRSQLSLFFVVSIFSKSCRSSGACSGVRISRYAFSKSSVVCVVRFKHLNAN